MPNPVNNINVSLVNGQLNVEDNGGIGVIANAASTTITWHLTGVLTAGNFQPVPPPAGAKPGFAWVQSPPAGYFGSPSVGGNGNTLSITDNHLSSATDGSWTYQLCVLYQNTIYCTTTSAGITSTVNNPIIINR